jgi:hypothetical protein
LTTTYFRVQSTAFLYNFELILACKMICPADEFPNVFRRPAVSKIRVGGTAAASAVARALVLFTFISARELYYPKSGISSSQIGKYFSM